MLTRTINLIYGVFVVAWGVSFYAWLSLLNDFMHKGVITLGQYLWTIAGAAAMYILAIAVHEAGHWFGGRAVGFIGTQFVVLWLRVERHGPRWMLKWAKRPAKLGGMVVQYPTSGYRLRRRKFLSVAAGPAANLLTALLALVLEKALMPPAWAQPGAPQVVVSAELLMFSLLSLFMGSTNLLPRKLTATQSNDGHLLWRLWRREPALDRLLVVSALTGSSYAGLRPRDWDPSLLNRLLKTADGSAMDCNASTYAYLHHIDADRSDLARPHLNHFLEQRTLLLPRHQQMICCEAAYFAVRYDRDVARAQQWLDCAQQAKSFEGTEGDFTQAVVAWALGQYKEAHDHFKRAEAGPLVHDANDIGSYLLALDRFADLRARLAAGTAPVTAAD